MTDYIPWMENSTAFFLRSRNENLCQGPVFWCDFKSGKNATLAVVICIVILLLILIFILILLRRSNYSYQVEKVGQGIVEENEFVYSRMNNSNVVKNLANLPTETLNKPTKRIQYSQPIVHQISNLIEDQKDQEEHFNTLDVRTFRSLSSVDSIRYSVCSLLNIFIFVS